MIKTQQALSSSRLRSGLLGCVPALCALFTVNVAVAEGAAPTPSRPVRSHHAAAEPLRHVREKSYAVTPRGRRLAVQDAAPSGGRASSGGGKSGSRAGSRSKGASESADHDSSPSKSKATPPSRSRRKKHQDDDDGPAMYKIRGKAQRNHGAEMVRVHGRLVPRRAMVESASFVAGPAPLRGSHDILVHQNLMADDEGLERIQDEADLDRMRTTRDLVDFDDTRALQVNPELPWNRRCARIWTVKFVQDLAAAYYAKFAQPLQLTSAARSVEYQLRLTHSNGNAAGIDGEAASPHLTGQAIDLGKRGMNRTQLAWMRSHLLPFIENGSIDVEEEFRQACFHISVYRSYLPVTRALPRHEIAQLATQPGSQIAPKPATVKLPAVTPATSVEAQPYQP